MAVLVLGRVECTQKSFSCNGVCFNARERIQVCFWLDVWVGLCPLYPRIFMVVSNKKSAVKRTVMFSRK